MKFTLGWLKDHLDTDAPLEAIVERLTMIGLEVEGVADRAKGMETFVVARVLDAKRHPDADKLQVCTVDTGKGALQVVCGAPNARKDLVGVFAPEGSYIPGTGITLKKANIRGVESNGMLLSERELALSDEHDGIIELDPSAPVGSSAAVALGLADPTIEIAITPNRGDCLGVRGVARDLAASGLGKLKPLVNGPVPGTFESPVTVALDFPSEAKSACPYFVGRFIRGVTNGESPKWLKDRLLAVGLRPISALVDITNLISLDLDRPLHVFDAAKLTGGIRVRLAKPGERMAALDGKTYDLDPAMTVVSDNAGPQALGGVIGAESSGCTETTTDVFVESAYFDPARTAATGRKLSILSDARYRFERGVDPAFVRGGMEVATRFILDLCGGEPSNVVVAGAEPEWRRKILLRPWRVGALAGLDLPAAEMERILSALGCVVEKNGDAHDVKIPSWRGDIEDEAGLIEEIARIAGYDKIAPVSPPRPQAIPAPALSAEQRRRADTRRLLAGRGFVEAVTYSFLPSAHADLFGGVPDTLRLVNPISADLDVMRPSLLPNLIAAAARNADRGIADARLFELGPQYAGDKPEDQAVVAAGIRAGQALPKAWTGAARPVDAFDAKADALSVLAAAGVPVEKLQTATDAPGWYHPGRSASLRLGPKSLLARFGEIHPRVLKAMGAKGPVAAFEVFLDALPKPKSKGTTKPLLKLANLQPLERDFAFVVDRSVAADAVVNAVLGADKALVVAARVFDLFQGAALGQGLKSLAVSVTLQPTDRTLTDADIEAVGKKIVDAAAKAVGAKLRA